VIFDIRGLLGSATLRVGSQSREACVLAGFGIMKAGG
jgi:hypothetical protein